LISEAELARLLEQIRRDPRPAEPWRALVERLVAAGDHSAALSTLEQRHGVGADSLSLFYDAIGPLVQQGEPAVDGFLAVIPANHLFQPVAAMIAAYRAVADERADEAVLLLRRALAMVPAIKSTAERDQAFLDRVFPLLVNQVEQLATAAEVEGFDAEEPPAAIEITGAPADLIVAAAADSRYIVRFAESYARSFADAAGPGTALHLHVIDPDAEAEAVLARLAGAYPLGISRERGASFGTRNVYFACARFLAAPALLAHYQRPILLTDIDLSFRRPIAALAALAGDADIALFETGHAAPQLRCDAAVVHLAPTEGAAHFLRILRRYLAEKLRADAKWVLDQAALWSITRARAGRTGIAYRDLAQASGEAQGAFIAKFQDDGSKRRERDTFD